MAEITEAPISPKDCLMVSHENRGIDFTSIYARLQERGVAVQVLGKSELRNLRRWLRKQDFSAYRRVILDLPFKHLHRAPNQLSRIAGLVVYEEDACQNFMPSSRWTGQFAELYQKIPNALIVNTGEYVSSRLRAQNIRSVFIPKGYDQQRLIYRGDSLREVPFGFIGRLRSGAYSERVQLLDAFAASLPLARMRSETASEYCDLLNSIQVFVSADIGIGEYMAKNFEAMACGCAVLAYRQGNGEEEALGLIDGVNISLYSTHEEAISKAIQLRDNPALRDSIAAAGRELAESKYSFNFLADQLIDIATTTELPSASSENSLLSRIFRRFSEKS